MAVTQAEFDQFDRDHPEVYRAWVLVSHEHRLDPWRIHLSASEVIEALRRKKYHFTNDHKPYYARKYNAEYPTGLQFVCKPLRAT